MHKVWLSVEDGDLVRNEDGPHLKHVQKAVLKWCVTHLEPVWVYSDGSFLCPCFRLRHVDPLDRSKHDIRSFPIEWY